MSEPSTPNPPPLPEAEPPAGGAEAPAAADAVAAAAAETLVLPPAPPAKVLKRIVIKKPLFRVVEVVRDAAGRLRPEGRIWHADVDTVRRFGRAVAANSASHEVLIADSTGRVLEKLAVSGPQERQVLWGQWRDIPLRPEPKKPAKPKPPPMIELPTLLLPD